jgi:hypothetical protein
MWSEPDLVGWLEKRGGKFTSWKKRFFVLQQSYLFYFDDDLKVKTLVCTCPFLLCILSIVQQEEKQ